MDIEQLHQLFLAHPTICTDTRKITGNSIFFALKGDNFNGNAYAHDALTKGCVYAVIDEAEHQTSNNHILVADALATLQQLATYHRNQNKARIIGLTGSNGKTTTKELINCVLSKKYNTIATKGNLNNHIGVPLTLLSITEETEIAIVEMGANHQQEIAFLCQIAQPDFGYITNFGKAHLEGFGGVEGVIKGKSELYGYLMAHDKTVFMNADDPVQLDKLKGYIKKYGFSTQNTQYYPITLLEANPFVVLQVEQAVIFSKLIGSYNFTNCAIAVLIGKYFNVALGDIKLALEAYLPENNRSQILEKNGHKIILDAYNANPTSMGAALENFGYLDGAHKIAFLGDMFELGEAASTEHQQIAELAANLNIHTVYLVGENFKRTTSKHPTFAKFEEIKAFILAHKITANSTILIKGSRGMAMERILELI